MGERLAVVLLALACCKKPLGPLPPGRTGAVRVDDCILHTTLVPARTTFARTDSVTASFRVTAECEPGLERTSVGDRESKYGRSEGLSVQATDAEGGSAGFRSPGETFGGAAGRVPLDRTHPYEETLRFEHYLEWSAPGRYEVVVTARPLIGSTMPKLEASVFVDVLP